MGSAYSIGEVSESASRPQSTQSDESKPHDEMLDSSQSAIADASTSEKGSRVAEPSASGTSRAVSRRRGFALDQAGKAALLRAAVDVSCESEGRRSSEHIFLTVKMRLQTLAAAKLPRDLLLFSARDQAKLLVDHLRLRHHFTARHSLQTFPRDTDIRAVFQERKGLPILLALIYREVAEYWGLSASLLAFPGRVLLKLSPQVGSQSVIVDPSTGDIDLSRTELEELAVEYGSSSSFNDEWLSAATEQDLSIRLLNNIERWSFRTGDRSREFWALTRLLDLSETSLRVRRRRAELALGAGAKELAESELFILKTAGLDTDLSSLDRVPKQRWLS